MRLHARKQANFSQTGNVGFADMLDMLYPVSALIKTGTVITVSARCRRDGDDVPLEALTQHLFIQFTERQIVSQRKLELDGREALRTELTAKLDGVKRRFRVIVLKKDSCVYDFSEIATEGKTTAESDRVFDDVVAGFATVKR